MRDHDWLGVLSTLPGVLGYFGLGGGMELMPYFVALLSFVGTALIAVLQWPVCVLLRRFVKDNASREDWLRTGAFEPSVPEAPVEGNNVER